MPENRSAGGGADTRELEDGLRFLHTLSMQSQMDLGLNSRVLTLIGQLVALGNKDFANRMAADPATSPPGPDEA